MSGSDCSLHPRSKACALCVIFCLIINVHPSYSSRVSSLQESGGHRPARSTTTDAEGDHGSNHDHQDHTLHHLDPDGHDDENPVAFPGEGGKGGGNPAFLKEIFDKYGKDGVISFEGFQNLVRNLHLGTVGVGFGEDSRGPHVVGGSQRLHQQYEHHMSDHDDYEGHGSQHEHDGDKRDDAGDKRLHTENEPISFSVGDEEPDPTKRDRHVTAGTAAHPNSHQNLTQIKDRDQNSDVADFKDSEMQQSDEHPIPSTSPDPNIGPTPHVTHLKTSFSPSQAPIKPFETHSSNPDRNLHVSDSSGGSRVSDSQLNHLQAQGANKSANYSTSNHHHNDNDTVTPAQSKNSYSERDTRDLGAQSRFRTRRLSSLRLHRGPPVLDGQKSAQTLPRTKPHPLRHWHQRQSSNRNSNGQDDSLVPPLNSDISLSGVEHSDHSAHKRVKRQASNDHHLQCLSPISLLNIHDIPLDSPISEETFIRICPALIQQIDAHVCIKSRPHDAGHAHAHSTSREDDHVHQDPDHAHDNHDHAHSDHEHDNNHTYPHSEYHVSQVSGEVWGYALLAVVVISMAGLLGVAVVPIMQKVFYNHLLQFLVALAIGTLTGDALLHLIPHALSAAHSHDEESHEPNASEVDQIYRQNKEDQHLMATWKSLVVLGGVYLFFITERLMEIITTRRRRTEKTRNCMDSPKLYRTVEEHESEVGAKLSKHSDVVTSCEEIVMVVHPGKDVRNMAEDMHEELHRDCEPEEREQLNHSHAPLHGHGHSHGPMPKNISSVAWMVIMGDGIHNFSDGLAIGAAFANSLSGGLSTTIAVFCHELPHEIGDFAVLLRAGMSVKQAMMYNCVSSFLCLFGMIVGVCVGNIGSVSLWIFALAGGMFIYIALVDMMPELKAINPRKGENPFVHFALQNLGMLTGATIMLLIALYVDKIQFSN